MTGAINVKFLQDGGVPLTNDLMAEIMNAISIYNVLGSLAGNLTIIQGCVVTGSTVSSGVVYINGDLLPFEGGYISDTVIVEETETVKTFENLQDKGLIYKKVAKFGIGNTQYNWTDFKSVKTLKQLAESLESKANQTTVDQLARDIEVLKIKTAPIINGGIVFPFRKPVDQIPAGWKECTDFRGKVIVGWNPNDADFKTLGGELGEKTHELTIQEMPSHTHKYTVRTPYGGNLGGFAGGQHQFKDEIWETQSKGGGQAHNNIQPSRIALFIEPNFQ